MPTYACRYGRVCDAAQAAATLLPVVVGGDGSEEDEAACSRYSVHLRYCSIKGSIKGCGKGYIKALLRRRLLAAGTQFT